MAGRASVEFYVGLAIKGRWEKGGEVVQEEAFVIRTFRNGLGVFVSKSVCFCIEHDDILTYSQNKTGYRRTCHVQT